MMFNYIGEIIDSYDYEFVNMNEYYEEIGIDFETDYYDYGGHVNILGAEKCTDYLGKLLKRYQIEDKRGVEKYDSWDQAYQHYLNEEKQASNRAWEHIQNGEFAPR